MPNDATDLTPDYWSQRYHDQNTPWDLGHVSRPLKRFIDSLSEEEKNLRILVPGGGSGHELVYLREQGFTNSYLLDWSEAVIENVRRQHPALPAEALIADDFFAHEATYDLILEQTFFCALDPGMRDEYVRQMYNLLAPGGRLAGVLFTFPLTENGPPFGGSIDEYRQRFAQYFEIEHLAPSEHSEDERQGKEAFFILRK
ncbi:MAG: methyltransferase [Bacteroidota bacterium]